MRKIISIFILTTIMISCNSNPEKENATKLLKEKIGNQLPFNDVKVAKVENGIGVIIDKNWCYWIDSNNKIYCVNGSSKSVYNVENPECEDAPIKSTFSDIEKIAQ